MESKNIIQELGTQNFVRIKVGVGAKPQGWDLADYVLGRVGKEDRVSLMRRRTVHVRQWN